MACKCTCDMTCTYRSEEARGEGLAAVGVHAAEVHQAALGVLDVVGTCVSQSVTERLSACRSFVGRQLVARGHRVLRERRSGRLPAFVRTRVGVGPVLDQRAQALDVPGRDRLRVREHAGEAHGKTDLRGAQVGVGGDDGAVRAWEGECGVCAPIISTSTSIQFSSGLGVRLRLRLTGRRS
jgi:hypothetical protein